MKHKQVRSILYDASYQLSSYELKEFQTSEIPLYCNTRALSKILGLSQFQSKESLIREVSRRLFLDDSSPIKQEDFSKELPKLFDQDFTTNLRLSEEKAIPEQNPILIDDPPKCLANITPPECWNIQKTKLAPEELYKCLGNFTRPNMIFYNFMRNTQPAQSLTHIIYLPYTPQILSKFSDTFIISFCKYLGFFTQYEESTKIEILKQKLRDLFYLVEDHDDLHLVVPCQSYLKNCSEIASEHCASHMCKICCQSSGNKLPCLIHSDFSSIFRFKYFSDNFIV